jgi:peroxiredoxin family protein
MKAGKAHRQARSEGGKEDRKDEQERTKSFRGTFRQGKPTDGGKKGSAMSEKPNAKRMSMIVTKGSLDWAYPPFILATTAAAMGLEVSMFFTFYGLTLLKKKLDLEDLRTLAVESDVRMIACQMTMDLFELKREDLIEGPELGGAATYIETASQSEINLFI